MLLLMLFLDNSLFFFNFLGHGFYSSEKGVTSHPYPSYCVKCNKKTWDRDV